MSEPTTEGRGGKPLTMLTVLGSRWLNPTMVRVTFSAPDFTPNGFTDAYVKLLFDERGPILDDVPERPTTRTYTVRRFDPVTRELDLDFVVHGDEGLAAPWATACSPGDRVIARGPGGKWAPSPDADWHLFVGDESAIPAIEAGLAALPVAARGLALIEVGEHTVELQAPEGVEVRWLVRGDAPYREERLAEEVRSLPWGDLGDVDVFAHGERGAMKSLRAVFRKHAVAADRLSISGYWALGRKEDEFQAEKRTDLGRI